jgi:hypothetical protein
MKKLLLSMLVAIFAIGTLNAQVVYEFDAEGKDVGYSLQTNEGWSDSWGNGFMVVTDGVAESRTAYQGEKYVSIDVSLNSNGTDSYKKYVKTLDVVDGNRYKFSFATRVKGPNNAIVIKLSGATTYEDKSKSGSEDWRLHLQEFVAAGASLKMEIINNGGNPAEYADLDSLILEQIPHVPTMAFNYDGEINEGAEDGEKLTVTVTHDTFVASLAPETWIVSNLPEGVTYTLARVDDTNVDITLVGNATGDYFDNDNWDVEITVPATDLTTSETDFLGGSFKFTAIQPIITSFFDGFENYETGADVYNLAGPRYTKWNDALTGAVIEDASAALSGNKFAQSSDIQGFSFIKSVKLVAGETYVWSFSTSAEAEYVLVNSVYADVKPDYSSITTAANPADTWTEHSYEFTVEAGREKINLTIYRWAQGTHISIDDYSLKIKDKTAVNLSDDGVLEQGAEDGEKITVSLEGDTYAASLTTASWVIENLPAGVTVASIARIDDTTAEIVLAGNSSNIVPGGHLRECKVTVPASDLVTSTEDVSNTGITFIAPILQVAYTFGNATFEYSGSAQVPEITSDPADINYSVDYKDGAEPITPGEYVVYVMTDENGYEGIDSVTVTITKATLTITLDGLAQDYNATPREVTYTLSPDVTVASATITYEGSETAPTNPGEYAVVVTVVDDLYEGTASGTLVITMPIGIAMNELEDMNVYPNPSHGNITIQMGVERAKLQIYSMNGALLYSKSVEGMRNNISLPAHINGLLIMKVSTDEAVKTQRISVIR